MSTFRKWDREASPQEDPLLIVPTLRREGSTRLFATSATLDRMYESSEASVSKGSSEMLMPRRFAGQVLNGMRRSGRLFQGS